jgi:hypothetical protein
MAHHAERAQLKRRGILAGVVALAAGVLGRATARPAVAGHDTLTPANPANVLHLGAVNDGGNAAGDESATSVVTRTVLVSDTNGPALRVRQRSGFANNPAVEGQADSIGVHGVATGPFSDSSAVQGDATAGARGVVGQSSGPTLGAQSAGVLGILGNAPSYASPAGVLGITTAGVASAGVHGIARTGTDASVPAVFAVGVCGDGISSGVLGRATAGVGVRGDGSVIGVQGQATGTVGNQGDGVRGQTNSTANAGVRGRNDGSGPGVVALTQGVGVPIDPSSGVPLRGALVAGANSIPAIAARSEGQSAVYAVCFASGGPAGVECRASNTFGVSGTSDASTGVLGVTHGEGFGVAGVARGAASRAAVFGRVDPPAGPTVLAGHFVGNVLIEGNLTVTGPAKSAAVPHPDGSHRRLYCQESPEAWFEDFGEVQLSNGRVNVTLDRDFAAIVRTDNYHVFLTPRGDCRGLYVHSQHPTGFEVRELQGGTSSLALSYRVVARRRDVTGPRLERVAVPERRELPIRPPLGPPGSEGRGRAGAPMPDPLLVEVNLPTAPPLPTAPAAPAGPERPAPPGR